MLSVKPSSKVVARPVSPSCYALAWYRKEHPKPSQSTNDKYDSPKARRASQAGDKVFNPKPAPTPVLGKRPAPGTVTAPVTHNGASKPAVNSFNPPTGPRSAMPQPPKATSSSMPPPPRPAAASTNMLQETRPFMENTVFDNNHCRAPASLHTMIGQPFHELDRRAWLRVRPEFSDIQKLLIDAFLLRNHDNLVSSGPDTAKLGSKDDGDLRGEWRMFVLGAARQGLLPFEPDTVGLNALVQETVLDEAGEIDENQVANRYDDVQMLLQMKVFANQVLVYDLPQSTMSQERWADLLKYETWEWAGVGFEWKVIFAQK